MEENANKINKIDLKALLAIADEQGQEQAQRKPFGVRLYQRGRLNFANGGAIKEDTYYAAKIANHTLILYEDQNAKRKASLKNGSEDIIFNLPSELCKRTAYTQAVELGKAEGMRAYKDYTTTTQEMDGVEYVLVDLDEFKKQKQEQK